ncbi:MAG: diguanylate cyclase [Zoogloeaceae bacterium]|jgi:diguanylate cyclase (GGDEF)-like protein|nr:diguanylate cyclase [Zoogloeaceae bacterium]
MLDDEFLRQKMRDLRFFWSAYLAKPDFAYFVDFATLLNSLTNAFADKSQSGLRHVSRQLEERVLSRLGDEKSHPIPQADILDLSMRVSRLEELFRYYAERGTAIQERRAGASSNPPVYTSAATSTRLCLMGKEGKHWDEMIAQLGYFGITVHRCDQKCGESCYKAAETTNSDDFSVYLIDMGGMRDDAWCDTLKVLRERRPMARILCMNMPDDFMFMNCLLLVGVNHCITSRAGLQQVLSHILENKSHNDDKKDSYRVMVVEDSRTAAQAIRKSLEENGITSLVLNNPLQSLRNIREFQPDLILMDMYMPHCTGVEAARVIRQHDEFLGIPIVFLSGETNIALQVEALRLGGDQFLTKPVNPVLMNAVVKSKIDRYRALRHSMQNDSLTDLLNHISIKQALGTALNTLPPGKSIAIAMLDIDHFKRVNDTYGHPVGDQVIRSLAWLLKQRLRRNDLVGRYGGEEFVIGLVGTNSEAAQEILNRIRDDFSHITFFGENGQKFTATFSAGLTSCPEDGARGLEAALELADKALYAAKHQGRNRIVPHLDLRRKLHLEAPTL